MLFSLKIHGGNIVFSNVVQTKVVPVSSGVSFTRGRHVQVPIKCYMEQIGIGDMVPDETNSGGDMVQDETNSGTDFVKIHSQTSKIIYHEKGFGKFRFQLQLYTNDKYDSQYPPDAYPLEVNLKDRLYFEAKVSSQDWLELFIDTCVATQTMNPHSTPQFNFIHEGYE